MQRLGTASEKALVCYKPLNNFQRPRNELHAKCHKHYLALGSCGFASSRRSARLVARDVSGGYLIIDESRAATLMSVYDIMTCSYELGNRLHKNLSSTPLITMSYGARKS